MQDLFERAGPAKGIALPEVHTQSGDDGADPVTLDALGGRPETHGPGELHDRADHRL